MLLKFRWASQFSTQATSPATRRTMLYSRPMAAETARSLRIGMLLDMYKPYVSGVTNYVSLHKRGLEARGHKFFIFPFGGGAYDDEELYVIRSPGLPFNVQATGLQVSYRYSRQAQVKLRTMDVLHAHHPFVSGP